MGKKVFMGIKGVTLLLIFVLIACGQGPKETGDAYERPGEKTAAAPLQKEEIVEEELPPVAPPQYEQGMITFFTGEVFIGDGSDWFPVVIGDFVEKDETVKVESGGYCEIQFGNTAVARLEENTVLKLNKIDVTPGKSKVGLQVAAGSVMSKVNKLAGGENYSVRTQSSVCGVRGTEFLVAVSDNTEESNTTVAVKEGAVAVLPTSADMEGLKEKAQQSGETGKAIQEALEKMEESAPVVEANQELTVTKEDSKETSDVMTAVEETLEKILTGEDTDTQEVAQIAKTIYNKSEEIKEKTEPAKKVLSQEKQESLAALDEMEVIHILTAPPADEAEAGDDTEEAAPAPAQPRLNRVSIQVSPADARIMLSGKEVGRGNFARVYTQDRNLVFTLKKSGYKDSILRVNTAGNSGKSYSVKLEQIPDPEPVLETIILNTEPSDAEILLDDKVVGKGSFSTEMEAGTAAKFIIRKEGFEEKTLDLDVVEGSGKTYTVSLKALPEEADEEEAEEEEPVIEKTITFTVRPAEAALSINGAASGQGSARGTWEEGTELTLTMGLRGFAEKKVTLTVGADSRSSYRYELEPRPLEHRISVSSGQLVRSIVSTGQLAVAADKSGTLAAATLDGGKLWTLATANNPNENCRPVIAGGKVYFSGAKEFVIADLQTGRELFRTSVESNESHMFGRRVTPLGSSVAYPTNESLEIRDAADGTLQNTLTVPGGSKMSAALYGQTLVMADQRGTLLRLNRNSGAVEKEIATGALQPVALAPAIKDNFAFFAGRKGIVTCVDLEAGRKVWEQDVSGGRSLGVYTDLEVGEAGVYMYARNTIYGFNKATGAQLFSPISGVTSPPAYSGGRLYFGKGSRMTVVNAANGQTLGSADMGAALTARPAVTGGTIAAGTEGGDVLIIVERALR